MCSMIGTVFGLAKISVCEIPGEKKDMCFDDFVVNLVASVSVI